MSTKWTERDLRIEVIAQDQETDKGLLAEVAELLYKMSCQFDSSKSPTTSTDQTPSQLQNNSVEKKEFDCA